MKKSFGRESNDFFNGLIESPQFPEVHIVSDESCKRSHSRVFPVAPKELSVALGGSGIEARVIDASFGGLAVFVPGQRTPFCDTGICLPVELRSPHLEAPLGIRATVHYVRDMENGYLYGLGVDAFAATWAQFPDALRRLFNQRCSDRVEPDNPVDAEVRLGETKFDAVLCDISTEGVAFLAQQDLAATLSAGTRVELSFRLPVAPQLLTVTAVVAQTRQDERLQRCGLLFDTEAEGYEEKCALIATYVQEQLGQCDWNDLLRNPAQTRAT